MVQNRNNNNIAQYRTQRTIVKRKKKDPQMKQIEEIEQNKKNSNIRAYYKESRT